METDDVGKLQKEIRSLKKQVERLEASRATFELMVDRNDNLLSRQLELTQRQAEELNRINLLTDSALDLALRIGDFDAYISKPFENDQLVSTVEGFLKVAS